MPCTPSSKSDAGQPWNKSGHDGTGFGSTISEKLNLDPLQIHGKRVHALRAAFRDLHRLREHAAGLAVAPARIEQVDVDREPHARLEPVADDLDRLAVSGDGVVTIARILERSETVAVNAGLTDAKSARIDLVLHRIERRRDRLAGPEIFEPAIVGRDTAFVDPDLLALWLAQAIGALDVGEIGAELGMHLADDEVAALHRPRGGDAERVRIGIAVAIPEKQRRLLAAVRHHRLHHAGIDFALLDAGARNVPAGGK